MIDNSEYLNLNSSNALLKSIEEPQSNTFFFIIHNSALKILDTIKSRCCEFKFSFTLTQKKNILTKIDDQYRNEFQTNSIIEDFYFDSPGNLIKYFLSLDKANINIKENLLDCIIHFIDQYKTNKSLETLTFITLFIQKFYNELCLNNNKNLNNYIINQSQILRQINNLKKFHLDEKNVFIWVKNILQNEK
jgi:DNA polymerase-3 subunit delta'